jgi:hypothetical protein
LTRDSEWLSESFDALDRVIFLGSLSALGITARWMRHRRRKHSFVYGIYDLDRLRIELSPVLRHDWVPECVALSVLHHEALHATLGMEHTHEFRLAENRFPHHVDSEVWCAENIGMLIDAEPPSK